MTLMGVTVAFDLDGTLVDTAPDLIGALNTVLAGCGLSPLPLESARFLVGRGARALIAEGFRAAGAALESPNDTELLKTFLSLYKDRVAAKSRPFEGVEAALETLKGQGATLVVCTNKPTDLSLLLLEKLALLPHFVAVIGADASPAPKPDPRHVWTAIRAANGRVDRAALVGDSETDSSAAKAAGVPMILVPYGYTNGPSELIPADVRIPDFSALPKALEDLFS
jgi:phosphoglycolate phosphatase